MNPEKQGYEFSVRVAELVRYLKEDGKNFPLSDELLSCGVEAGMFLQKPDKFPEACAALERAVYLLRMAVHSGYLTEAQGKPILTDAAALLGALERKR